MKESLAGWIGCTISFRACKQDFRPRTLRSWQPFPFPQDLSHQVSGVAMEMGWVDQGALSVPRAVRWLQGATKKGSKHIAVGYYEGSCSQEAEAGGL